MIDSMDLVKYVKENRSKLKNYQWLKQFDEDYNGRPFTPLKFQGMKIKYGMDEVADGVAGDRWMRKNAKTNVLEGITMNDLRQGLTNDQCNDLINYSAWNAFDILSLRVSEGQSEIIPRAQYEFTSFVRQICRNPEWIKLLIYEVGWKRFMKRIRDSNKDLGSHLANVGHCWSVMNCNMFGAIAIESLGLVGPDDPLMVDKKRSFILPWAAAAYARRNGNGSVYESQQRYAWPMDQSVVDFLMNNMEPLDANKLKLFKRLDAAATMMGFNLYYDNRGGQADRGPHIVEGGKIMIIRSTPANESQFWWTEPGARRSLPYAIIMAFVIDPEKIGLQEIRLNGISTTFSQPANLWPGVEQACMFLRYEEELPEPLPFENLKKLHWSEVEDLIQKLEETIFDWYTLITEMDTRTKVNNGHMTYSWIASIGYKFKCFGIWDKYKDLCDYWEWPPLASDAYYQAKGKVASEIMPVKLFSGGGWSDIPDKLAGKSRYRDEILKRAYDLGWESDLTGMKPIPAELKGMFDEDRIFRPNIPFDAPDDWME